MSLENDMIPRWLSKKGRRLGGFVNDGYFIDIGIPEAYFQFQEDVRNLRWSFDNLETGKDRERRNIW